MCGQAFVIVLTNQRPQREVVPRGNGFAAQFVINWPQRLAKAEPINTRPTILRTDSP